MLSPIFMSLADVTIGDTITDYAQPAEKALAGYKAPMQMVFSDFYPGNNTDYSKLRDAFDKLALNDASFSFSPTEFACAWFRISLRLSWLAAYGDHSGTSGT